jgi:hypothetical protein
MHRKIFNTSVILIFTLGFALAAFANVPPPPVNQIIGIPDTTFGNLVEDDCRFCHEDPDIVDDANIPNRHHLNVNTPVPSGVCAETGDTCERNTDCPGFDPTVSGGASNACSVHTDRPFPAGDTAGNYDCFSCHNMIWDPDTQSTQLEIFRNCIFCHIQDPLAETVHHRTTKAKNLECTACHGPINDPRIDEVTGEFVDGHIVPIYDPSLVTPCPSQTACLNVPYKELREDGAGACDFCHAAGVVTDSQFTDNFPPPIDVFTNGTNHHSTGIVPAPFDDKGRAECSLCHNVGDPDAVAEIRGCERCHGYQSLHNIQVDSPMMPTGMIEPGNEMPWWGHIGSNNDCQGCHGFAGSASAPNTGPIIPDIGTLSAYNVIAGTDTSITISGNALQNMIMGNLVTADVELTAADGSTTTLTPDAVSDLSMDVTIPGTLATGNYALRAVKGSSQSNAAVISIIPGVTITGVDCDKKRGVLTVTGSGFGDKVPGTDVE